MGGRWSYSRPYRFTLEVGVSGTRWMGGWVGLRDSLDAMEKRMVSGFCRESSPGRLALSPSPYRLNYPGSGGIGSYSDFKAIPVTGRGGK
jgi:hypothetical protein